MRRRPLGWLAGDAGAASRLSRSLPGLVFLIALAAGGGAWADDAKPDVEGAGPECLDATRTVWTAPAQPGALADGWSADGRAQVEWGAGTAAIVDDGGPTLVATYPAGSINPGNPQAPEGGVGIKSRFPESVKEGCLTYEVRFDDGFDFAQGGKLPGLYGGKHNAGCSSDTASGFSARSMWGRDGVWFLYPYFADRTTQCGGVLGAGRVFFAPGRWYRVAQYMRLNAAGQSNGLIDMWIDGEPVLHIGNAEIRGDNKLRIEGVMVESFFGGHDPSRASPADQSARFRNFTFRVPES